MEVLVFDEHLMSDGIDDDDDATSSRVSQV